MNQGASSPYIIEVREEKGEGGPSYAVMVQDDTSKISYRVTVSDPLYQKLTQGKVGKCDCVKAAFRFLLDHEPKEYILKQFDLSVISEYFSNFEAAFPKYLS